MKNKKELSKNAFDKQAKTYDDDKKGSHARKLYPLIIHKVIQVNGKKILDVGCGTGELMNQLFLENPSLQLTGLDLSNEMLAVARNKLKENAEFVLGDAENLPFVDESFDIVICNDSFHHYPQPQMALLQIHRVLKNKGKIIIGDYYQKALVRLIMNCFMRFCHEGDIKIYSEKEMKRMMMPYFHNIVFKIVDHCSFIIEGEK